MPEAATTKVQREADAIPSRTRRDRSGERMPRISLVFPVLPPTLDGIGDYTASLATELARRCDVEILTTQEKYNALPGVAVRHVSSMERPGGEHSLAHVVAQRAPDWLLVQYNPFSYGRWGFNPLFPLIIRRIKRASPNMRLALMVHEPFVPVVNWKWALMTLWQRWQLWMLGRAADVIFFSIDPWVHAYRGWFPQTPVCHLPVSSNIPRAHATGHETRTALGIDPDTLVVGVFGSAHPARLLHFIQAAVEALTAACNKVTVLYVGSAGTRVRQALGSVSFFDAGPLAPEAVSRHFAAMDLYLAPFRKGVSSRRGSFMVGIQHGIATLSTYGVHTDAMLLAQNGRAFQLVADDDIEAFREAALRLGQDGLMRRSMGEAARQFFDATLTWECIAGRLLAQLQNLKG